VVAGVEQLDLLDRDVVAEPGEQVRQVHRPRGPRMPGSIARSRPTESRPAPMSTPPPTSRRVAKRLSKLRRNIALLVSCIGLPASATLLRLG